MNNQEAGSVKITLQFLPLLIQFTKHKITFNYSSLSSEILLQEVLQPREGNSTARNETTIFPLLSHPFLDVKILRSINAQKHINMKCYA